MTPGTLAILLLAAGLLLLVAEMLLPSGGILGVLGAITHIACIVICFRMDSRLGFGVMVAMVVAVPFAGMLWVKVWPKTPVGRRMILAKVSDSIPDATVSVGQTGTTISELRPMGVVAIGADRIEAPRQLGTIPSGAKIQVVDIVDRRPTVRAIA